MPNFSTDLEFHKLVTGCRDVDLIALMLELAADRYPTLDRLDCLLEIDRLGVQCASQPAFNDATSSVFDRLAAVSHVLYEVEGFHGNRESYYDPRNSYLNDVLSLRTGIPISLGIVYMSVAARTGMRMFGVNAPGHFMLGAWEEQGVWFVDPFSGGEVLDRAGCVRRIEKVLGQEDVICSDHLRPAAPRDIVARVLRNLKAVYARDNCWQDALPVQKRLTALLPKCIDEHRDLGLILLRAGQPHKALPILQQALDCGASDDSGLLKDCVRTARKLVAEMN